MRRHAALAGLLFCALVVGFGNSETVEAATRTWTGLGPTNNWSDAANWLGNAIPGAADVATFDATGNKNATINAVINVAGVSVGAGYTGTITQGPGIAATIGASGFSQAGGTFAGGTSATTISGPFALTGGSFAAASGTLSVSGNFTISGGAFNANGGTTSFGGGAATLTVSTPAAFGNVTFAAGAKTIAAGTTLTATGPLSLTSGNLNGTGTLAAQADVSQALAYGGGTATLLVNGAGAQTLNGASTSGGGNLPLLVINKPSGTPSASRARSGRRTTGRIPRERSARVPRPSSSPAARSAAARPSTPSTSGSPRPWPPGRRSRSADPPP